MTAVVISQPMLFPWVGLLEQVRLAGVYVHYDDVQFSKGGFTNRVQVKTAAGSRWLTIPLRGLRLGQPIREVAADPTTDWRHAHLGLLAHAYAASPFLDDMLALVRRVYAPPTESVCDIAVRGLHALCDYFALGSPDKFQSSSALAVTGASSERVLDVVKAVGGDTYITGHGAKQYLDHELFERAGVRVEYLDYQKASYPQLHGEFTPFVSALDLVANVGPAGREVIRSGTKYWREFV